MFVKATTPTQSCSDNLVNSITELGLNPIITPDTISVSYDGPCRAIWSAIICLFEAEDDHTITTSGERRTNTVG